MLIYRKKEVTGFIIIMKIWWGLISKKIHLVYFYILENMNAIGIREEHQVMRLEHESLLNFEAPNICKFLNEYIEHILRYLNKPSQVNEYENRLKTERVNLQCTNGQEGVKCSLLMCANELKNIEINYKPSARHNNYVYKSKEECSWNLYQISNCSDILKSILLFMENLNFKSLDESLLHFDHIIELFNQARNVLIFPKKRNILELQTQKNMKIFPLIPNELVFSFYIQGFKLILAIYIVKANESNKHILECNSIDWLNNVMILLTTCLQKVQQMKDKLVFFEQINIANYD